MNTSIKDMIYLSKELNFDHVSNKEHKERKRLILFSEKREINVL